MLESENVYLSISSPHTAKKEATLMFIVQVRMYSMNVYEYKFHKLPLDKSYYSLTFTNPLEISISQMQFGSDPSL